jgi:hypothetical protein
MPPPSTGPCNPLGKTAKCETPWIEPACSSESSVTIYQSTWHNISEALELKKRLTYYSNTEYFHANTAHLATKVKNNIILQ